MPRWNQWNKYVTSTFDVCEEFDNPVDAARFLNELIKRAIEDGYQLSKAKVDQYDSTSSTWEATIQGRKAESADVKVLLTREDLEDIE